MRITPSSIISSGVLAVFCTAVSPAAFAGDVQVHIQCQSDRSPCTVTADGQPAFRLAFADPLMRFTDTPGTSKTGAQLAREEADESSVENATLPMYFETSQAPEPSTSECNPEYVFKTSHGLVDENGQILSRGYNVYLHGMRGEEEAHTVQYSGNTAESSPWALMAQKSDYVSADDEIEVFLLQRGTPIKYTYGTHIEGVTMPGQPVNILFVHTEAMQENFSLESAALFAVLAATP